MYSDCYDENIFKFKKEYIVIKDKIDNKIENILFKVIDIIIIIHDKLEKSISYINSIFFESLLLDDSQLKKKINAKIDDTLSFVWNKIYRKNLKKKKK